VLFVKGAQQCEALMIVCHTHCRQARLSSLLASMHRTTVPLPPPHPLPPSVCCCSVFIHPQTQQQYAAAFDAAVSGLRYGSITINCPATTAFSVTALPWGAYPGGWEILAIQLTVMEGGGGADFAVD
jgi:hypothetical protein